MNIESFSCSRYSKQVIWYQDRQGAKRNVSHTEIKQRWVRLTPIPRVHKSFSMKGPPMNILRSSYLPPTFPPLVNPIPNIWNSYPVLTPLDVSPRYLLRIPDSPRLPTKPLTNPCTTTRAAQWERSWIYILMK